jgi:hypothetical protein
MLAQRQSLVLPTYVVSLPWPFLILYACAMALTALPHPVCIQYTSNPLVAWSYTSGEAQQRLRESLEVMLTS